MTRRTFLCGLTLGTLAAPLAAEAQQERKAQRIGLLAPRSASDALPFNEAFRQGLSELGWVEGQNIVIEYRFAEGSYNRLPDLAAELVRLNVDVIVAGGTAASAAAKNVTGTIPIVMTSGGDPVESGLIASLW